MDTTVTRTHSSDRISFRELTDVLWRQRWLIVAVTLVVTTAVGALSLVLPKKYTATTILAPVSNSSGEFGSSGASSLLSQMGGLASLAGVSAPDSDKRSEDVAILQSEGLAQRFIQANGLIPILAQGNHKISSLWQADVFFRKRVAQVTTNTTTGLVLLSVTWTDPKLAAKWANDMVRMTNDYIRGKAIAESQRDIAYLNDQASKTDVIGVKQAIYSILEGEIKKQMLAKGSEEYALKVIDQAIAPEGATSPRPLFWTLGAFLGCIAAAVLGGLCWLAWRDV